MLGVRAAEVDESAGVSRSWTSGALGGSILRAVSSHSRLEYSRVWLSLEIGYFPQAARVEGEGEGEKGGVRESSQKKNRDLT